MSKGTNIWEKRWSVAWGVDFYDPHASRKNFVQRDGQTTSEVLEAIRVEAGGLETVWVCPDAGPEDWTPVSVHPNFAAGLRDLRDRGWLTKWLTNAQLAAMGAASEKYLRLPWQNRSTSLAPATPTVTPVLGVGTGDADHSGEPALREAAIPAQRARWERPSRRLDSPTESAQASTISRGESRQTATLAEGVSSRGMGDCRRGNGHASRRVATPVGKAFEAQQPRNTPARPSRAISSARTPGPDIVLGDDTTSQQYGLIGMTRHGEKVAIDFNSCHTVCILGAQGTGKSYSAGILAEGGCVPVPGINLLRSPLGVAVISGSWGGECAPEYPSSIGPNTSRDEVSRLLGDYRARPAGLTDMTLAVPRAKLEQRQLEFPAHNVIPITVRPEHLGVDEWRFLLGASNNDALYLRQLDELLEANRGNVTPESLRHAMQAADLPKGLCRLVDGRLRLAERYIDGHGGLGTVLRPGRVVVADLRDEYMRKEDAMKLVIVLARVFGRSTLEGGASFNKLILLDEAHEYLDDADVVGQMTTMMRTMRHLGTTIVIASQSPQSVPKAIIELCSVVILHQMTSPGWLKHLQGALEPMSHVDARQLARLPPGEALVWARRSTDVRFRTHPQQIVLRPRFSKHGGSTRTAVRQ